MPVSNFRRINLDLLEPDFRLALFEVIARCNERGVRYVATHGYRTYGEQMELWTQGRTKPGPKVTAAKGGESAHNFGLAVDFVRDLNPNTPGVEPGWSESDFSVLIEEAEKAGLHSGRGYKDFPHIGVAGFVSATELKPLHDVWQKSADTHLSVLDRLRETWKCLVKKE